MNLLSYFSRPSKRERRVARLEAALRGAISAMYDASKDTADTQRLFESAKHDWHADSAIRKDLAKKATCEFLNNGYLKGMVRTKGYDLIGTGPRLHILHDDREAATEIEQKFAKWVKRTKAAKKLRTMVSEWMTSGEGLGLLYTDPRLKGPIKLNFRPLDVNQIEDISDGNDLFEGIKYDEHGVPLSYLIRKRYTALGGVEQNQEDAVEVDADYIIHLYSQDRAGQVRGVSELATTLLPAAWLRSFTAAVVKAAKIAASISFLVHTDEVGEDSTACEPYDMINLEHGSGLALPDGYKGTQLKAEQPIDTYGDFKGEMLNEIGRPSLMPRLKMTGDASKYNYSSGRLDGQEYNHSIDVDRAVDVEIDACDKLFEHWVAEAMFATNEDGSSYLSAAAKAILEDREDIDVHRWAWDGRPHVDPSKESKAEETQLKNGVIGLHELYTRRGLDCESELAKAAKVLGLSVEEYKKLIVASIFQTQGQANEEADNNSSESLKEND